MDPHVAAAVLEALALRPGEAVVEIGAGFGALTEALLGTGSTVIAVERDRRLVRALKDRLGRRPHLQLVLGDILRLDWASLAVSPVVIAGNLPYGITSPLLDRIVQQRPQVLRAVLTVQREVAQRVAAVPGTKAFGALTCFVQCHFEPSLMRVIPPNAFYPQPAVTSAIVRLTPREPPLVTQEELEPLTIVVQALFQRRRKTLVNGLLNPALSLTRAEAMALLREVGLDPAARPETVPVPSFVALARAWMVLRQVL